MQGSTAARKPAVQISRTEQAAHLLARTVSVHADDFAGSRMLGDELPALGIGSELPRFGRADRAGTDEFGWGEGDPGERLRRKVSLREERSVSDEHLYVRPDTVASPVVAKVVVVANARSDLIAAALESALVREGVAVRRSVSVRASIAVRGTAVSSCEFIASGSGQKTDEDVGT